VNTELNGKMIAILATDGFEQSELIEPMQNLQNAGATIEILSIKEGKIKAWNRTDWGSTIKVDRLVSRCTASEYEALVLPGGV
jgi:protease I